MSNLWRSVIRDRTLLLSATVILALSIGANTALFSVANSILLRPLPYPRSELINWISERSGPAQQDIGAAPDYYRLRDGNRVFDAVAALNPVTVNWTAVERPEQLDGAEVSSSFFRVMGRQPLLGRCFAAGEEGSRAPALAVLSYAFWQSRLGGDPRVVGRTISIDRLPRVIVGVMPRGFDYPAGTQVWMPMRLDEADQRILSPSRPIFTTSIIARRKPEASPEAVRNDLNRLAGIIREEYHVFPTRFRWDLTITASPLQEHLTGPIRPPLLALGGAAAMVLLIACVNLANLLVARSLRRRRELAIRLALGATRGRLFRQMFGESLLLALPGAAAGLATGWLAVRALHTVRPDSLLRYPPVSLDARTLVFTLLLTVAVALCFGMASSVFAAGSGDALQAGRLAHAGGPGPSRLRKTLLVTELALSLILVLGAGLLARAYLRLIQKEPGFRTDHLLTFRVNPAGPLDHDASPFYTAVLERLEHLPGVRSAALVTDMPLAREGYTISGRIRVEGRPPAPFQERPVIDNTLVSPGYFRTLGIPLRRGRIFEPRDAPRPPRLSNYGAATAAPVVVNEAFVRKLFPSEDPLGRRIVFGPDHNPVTWTILGVVGDVRGAALEADPPPVIYRCACDGSRLFRAGFVLRSETDPGTLGRAAAAQVRAVDPDQPVFDVKTMEERRDSVLSPRRFQLAIIGSLALIALLLAAAGVYGVTSYLVARRTREFAIRVAAGARPGDIFGMVLREAIVLALTAVAAGLGGAWLLTRSLRSLRYGVPEADAAAFCLAAGLLAATVIVAALGPARSALRADPARALREE